MSTIRATFVQHGSSAVPNITLNASGQVIVASGIVSSGTFAAPSGSAAAPGVYFDGDTDTGLYSPGANQVAISTNGTGRLFVDSNGRLLVGNSQSITTLVGAGLQVQSTGGNAYASIGRWVNSVANPGLIFNKSRGGSVGTLGIVQSGDNLGEVSFTGDDGASFVYGARIQAQVDGTPGLNDMPGRLIFSTTADGASSPTERLRITSAGRVGIGSSSPAVNLDVSDASGGRIRVGGAAGAGVEFNGSDTRIDIPAANTLAAYTIGTERVRIDSSGRLLVGTSSARTNFFNGAAIAPFLQIEGTGSARMLSVFSNNTDGGVLVLGRQGGSTPGGNTLVANNDEIGIISFQASDGTDPTECARIQALIDGAPGNNDTPGRLVFSTTADGASSPTERMRITSAGDVGINVATPLAKLDVRQATNSAGVFFWKTDTGAATVLSLAHSGASGATSRSQIDFGNSVGVIVGTITSNGSSTAYNTSSDYRLKENVAAVTDGITRLQQLKPCRFNFTVDPSTTVDGFLAHEAQEVVPECVTGEKDEVDADGNPIYQGIDQSKLVPLLTAALQEAIGEIESLKARVAALESA